MITIKIDTGDNKPLQKKFGGDNAAIEWAVRCLAGLSDEGLKKCNMYVTGDGVNTDKAKRITGVVKQMLRMEYILRRMDEVEKSSDGTPPEE